MMNEKQLTKNDLSAALLPGDPLASPTETEALPNNESRIKNGIEFYRVRERDGSGFFEDCQCARCGSSCSFHDCDNCGGEGEIEDSDWQFEGEYHRCDWCRGAGGHWSCISGEKWCRENPMPGREDQPVMGSADEDAMEHSDATRRSAAL